MSNRKFNDIIFTFCGPRLSFDKVAPLEKSLGFALPDDYRHFLAEINGGISIKRAFRCAPDPPPFTDGKASYDSFAGEPPGLRFGPPSEEEKVFFQHAFRPRVVKGFYAVKRADTDCIGKYCREATILDEPDIRSLIPIAETSHGHLFLSLNKDHFGFIYNGKFNTKAMPYWTAVDADVGPEDQPLAELEHCFVAESFSRLLSSLQLAKTLYVDGYQPSHTIRLIHVKTFDDNPNNENLPLDLPAKEKPKKSSPNREKDDVPPDDPAALIQIEQLPQKSSEGEYVWTGKIDLAHWKEYISGKSTWVGLRIVSECGDNIPGPVFEALRHTVENQKKLKEIILQAAAKRIGEREDDAVEEPDDLKGKVALDGINIIIPPDKKPVQVGYVLPCDYSDEHGFAVLLCGDEAIDAGFYDILDYYHD